MQDLPLFEAIWHVCVRCHMDKSLILITEEGEHVFVILTRMILLASGTKRISQKLLHTKVQPRCWLIKKYKEYIRVVTIYWLVSPSKMPHAPVLPVII